jgi:ribonuclease Z
VKVTAFEVDHGDIKPAFGYRIDFRDARSCCQAIRAENLIRMAQGTDVLVHEVAFGEPNLSAQRQYIVAQHIMPDRAAEVFRRVHPRLAIYSHIQLLGNVTSDDVMALTRMTYSHPSKWVRISPLLTSAAK